VLHACHFSRSATLPDALHAPRQVARIDIEASLADAQQATLTTGFQALFSDPLLTWRAVTVTVSVARGGGGERMDAAETYDACTWEASGLRVPDVASFALRGSSALTRREVHVAVTLPPAPQAPLRAPAARFVCVPASDGFGGGLASVALEWALDGGGNATMLVTWDARSS
jgi:hypothetical protein